MSSDKPLSILELPAQPEAPLRLTPRSLQACGKEGVDASELVYRPIEEFAEKNLVPRLIKLRYDFYEAKRRDLIDAVKRTRESIVTSSSKRHQQLSSLPQASLVSEPEADKWLEAVLRHELAEIAELERGNSLLSADEEEKQAKIRAESQRLKELNDKRRGEEEAKQQEIEVRLRVERERAREEFERQQRELQTKQELEEQKRQELYEKSLKDMEDRRQYEVNKKRKQQELFRQKQVALKNLSDREVERTRIRIHRENIKKQQLRSSMEKRTQRWEKSKENNLHLEIVRREDYLRRLNTEQQREARLQAQREEDKERSSRRQLALLLKRKSIMDDAEKKAEERRMIITQQQESIDERLREYSQKRDKFLAFKRELEHLKEVNKQMNVQRQRKREEFKRDQVADEVVHKDLKVQHIRKQKLKIWEQKRAKTAYERYVRETVKAKVMDMRIKSRVDSSKVKDLIDSLLHKNNPTVAPTVVPAESDQIAPPPYPKGELSDHASSNQFARAAPDDRDSDN